MAEDLLTTQLDRYGPRRTLFVTGELDVATAPILEGAVDAAIDGQGDELCLDLGGLDFIDASGARAIVDAHDKAVNLGSRVVVVSPTPVVRQVLEIMGLDQVMDIWDGDLSLERPG